MAYPRRREIPGATYYVYNIARKGQSVFREKNEYSAFLDVLDKLVEDRQFEVIAYSLLEDEYHMLLRAPDQGLASGMQRLAANYTRQVNRWRGVTGQIFRRRYSADLANDEAHMRIVGRAIHRKAVEADLIQQGEQYNWSSQGAYMGLHPSPSWLTLDDRLYPASCSSNRPRYGNFLEEPLQYLKCEAANDADMPNVNEQDDSSELVGMGIDELLYAVGIRFNVPPSKLRVTSKSADRARARYVAIYLSREILGHSYKRIANDFNMEQIQSVGVALSRFKNRLRADDDLRDHVDEISTAFIKAAD